MMCNTMTYEEKTIPNISREEVELVNPSPLNTAMFAVTQCKICS